ncbi:MAG: hypothetical protein EHM78_13140 [Myxococcaceae bacterium]|nr:MAG: hypothetical protein EHM78_13140 [Myxococcaceae bacterium]
MLHRRDLLGAFTAYALLAELSSAHAARRARSIRSWLDRQDALARGLASGTLDSEVWRREVEALGSEADVERLIAEALPSPSARAFPTDPARRILRYRDAEGRPRTQPFAVLLFEFERTSVIPHAHRGMQSAHLVVHGALRARTYDRLGEAPGALLLRPAGDRRLEPGHVSSIGPGRENVHWFVPLTPRAATFDVIVTGLDPDGPEYQVQPVDPLGATDLGEGRLRAPLLGFEESARRYAIR